MHLESCFLHPCSEAECCFGWFPQAEPCCCFTASFLFNWFQLYVQYIAMFFKRVCVGVWRQSSIRLHDSSFAKRVGIDVALSFLLVSSSLISDVPGTVVLGLQGRKKLYHLVLPVFCSAWQARYGQARWSQWKIWCEVRSEMFGVSTFAQNAEVFAAAFFGWKDQDFEPQHRENNVEKPLRRS